MSEDRLPPIPMPASQWWKHFRQKGLPAVTFIGVLMLSVWLWGANLANPLVMGQAESLQADLASPIDGELVHLDARLYKYVQAGDVLAIVAGANQHLLSNTLSVIRAEMDAALAEVLRSPSDQIRLAELRLEWLNLQGDIAALKANLPFVDAELARVEKLHAEGIANPSELELARAKAKQVQEEIAGKEKAVSAAEAALLKLDSTDNVGDSKFVQAQLHLATERLRLAESELSPIVLRAPISGHITRLDVAANSTVSRRQPLLTVSAAKVERIVGFIPQPVRVEPKLGMPVEIRTRGTDRVVAISSVVEIGPRIELFDAPLRVRGMGTAQERGLPVVVSVPEDMRLRPGELVDLRLMVD